MKRNLLIRVKSIFMVAGVVFAVTFLATIGIAMLVGYLFYGSDFLGQKFIIAAIPGVVAGLSLGMIAGGIEGWTLLALSRNIDETDIAAMKEERRKGQLSFFLILILFLVVGLAFGVLCGCGVGMNTVT